MKIYLLKTGWNKTEFGHVPTTKAFKTKASMCKAFANLITSQDEEFSKYNHFECKTYKDSIKVYRIINATGAAEHWAFWDMHYETVEVEE